MPVTASSLLEQLIKISLDTPEGKKNFYTLCIDNFADGENKKVAHLMLLNFHPDKTVGLSPEEQARRADKFKIINSVAKGDYIGETEYITLFHKELQANPFESIQNYLTSHWNKLSRYPIPISWIFKTIAVVAPVVSIIAAALTFLVLFIITCLLDFFYKTLPNIITGGLVDKCKEIVTNDFLEAKQENNRLRTFFYSYKIEILPTIQGYIKFLSGPLFGPTDLAYRIFAILSAIVIVPLFVVLKIGLFLTTQVLTYSFMLAAALNHGLLKLLGAPLDIKDFIASKMNKNDLPQDDYDFSQMQGLSSANDENRSAASPSNGEGCSYSFEEQSRQAADTDASLGSTNSMTAGLSR